MTKQELRGQLRKALGMCDDKACKSKCTQQLDKAIKLIEAYAADIEREARIDELHNMMVHPSVKETDAYIHQRLLELAGDDK